MGGGKPLLAVGVKESVERPVLAVDLLDDVLLAQDPPDSDEPLFPLEWGAWFVIGVQQELPARWAAPALGSQEPGGLLVHGRGLALTPPNGPVLVQGRVVGGRPATDRDMPDDLRPYGEAGVSLVS